MSCYELDELKPLEPYGRLGKGSRNDVPKPHRFLVRRRR